MPSDNFKKDLNKIRSLGLTEDHAGCFISNYHDAYICDNFRGGCKHKEECEEMLKKLQEKEA
jgi:hypothetical protein